MNATLLAILLAAQTPQTGTLAPATSAPTESPAAAEDGPRARAEALLDAKDARPELLYNAGVEMYRAGELELARGLFASAASKAKASVAARSMYNRGTTSYAEAVQSMKNAGESGQPPADAQKAVMESLERSLRELKDAARADPSNADARANAELAYRVLKELKKQQDQQQQEQQNDQQKQDQQQQQQNDQQKQDQQQQQQNDQQKQDQQQQQQNDQQKQDQQQQNDQQKQDQQQQQQQAEADKKPMTKQEVERLLQRIRDKERARLLEKLSRERARTKPAPKDW